MEIEFLIGFFVFLFGATFGSFYNVVIYRIPLDMSIAKGRSMCFSCKHNLNALDLFPLFSYIFLRGKCRYCGEKISIRYFLVELLTGILFLVAYIKFSISYEFVLMIIFWSMLVIVGFIDFDTMAIYDIVLVVFSSIILIILFLYKGLEIRHNIFAAFIGFAIYYTIYFVAKIIYKQEVFGFGDVLLNTSIGLVLGYPKIIIASFLSFFIGLFFIIILALIGKKIQLKQEIPFGPYMCISAFLMSLYGQNIIDFYMSTFINF